MLSAIRDIIEETIKEWNYNLKATGHLYHIEIKSDIRKKKFYVDKNNFVEKPVAEIIMLRVKDDPSEKDLLLYRKELILHPSELSKKGKVLPDIERDYLNRLYRTIFYEAIGVFAIVTEQNILNQDYAEYDIVNDRLKQHENANGMVVKAIKAGPFWEEGTEFDVFIDLSEDRKYAIYTQHEAGRRNNGIATVDADAFIVAQAATKRLILDLNEDKKVTLIK